MHMPERICTCGSTFHDHGYQHRVRCPECHKKHSKKPRSGFCEACEKTFDVFGPGPIPTFCRAPGCISSTFGHNASLVSHVQKKPSVSKREACKIVVCDRTDDCFSTIAAKYPWFEKESFEKTREGMMRGHCGQPVRALPFSVAVFLVFCSRNEKLVKKHEKPIRGNILPLATVARELKCRKNTVCRYMEWGTEPKQGGDHEPPKVVTGHESSS